METLPKLVIGDKNLSSWSMRPWLALRVAGVPFEEVLIPFSSRNWHSRVMAHGGPPRVPAWVEAGGLVVWESLAICERVAELAPEAKLWPTDGAARATARAVACEIHASFGDLRREHPMDASGRYPGTPRSRRAQADIERVRSMVETTRARFGNAQEPFLFGHFSIADAMLAPIVTRFVTYGIETHGELARVFDALLALPPVREWLRDAEEEVNRGDGGLDNPGSASARSGIFMHRSAATMFALAWTRALERGDIEAISRPFAEEATFVSPNVTAVTGEEMLIGRDAIASYFARVFAGGPISVTVDDVVWDPEANALVLLHTIAVDGQKTSIAERMRFGLDGKIVDARSWYAAASPPIDPHER